MKQLAIFILLSVCVTQCHALTVEEIISATVAHYETMETLYIEFSNVLCDETSGTCHMTDGIIYFQKPSSFRLEMENPEQIYIGDSVTLWIYIPAENRAIKQSMTELPFQVNPDLFLRDYEERFTPTLLEETDETYMICLLPKDSADVYERINVAIAKDQYTIVGIAVFDGIGSENKYSFHKVEVNPKIAKKLLEFNPPEGVQVDEY
jgi:chaperone LolA